MSVSPSSARSPRTKRTVAARTRAKLSSTSTRGSPSPGGGQDGVHPRHPASGRCACGSEATSSSAPATEARPCPLVGCIEEAIVLVTWPERGLVGHRLAELRKVGVVVRVVRVERVDGFGVRALVGQVGVGGRRRGCDGLLDRLLLPGAVVRGPPGGGLHRSL